ncbi:pentapeptide repeat-containing protein [Mesorhizobium muleiense]|uniref:pentapeptide repeat-containing protein n=1 Tax=Mesorhizobium muleiense TaxID=1004279 RepID=UPI0039AFCCB5
MRAGDRGAHAFGVGDHRFALAAQPVDERADAGFILRIGALDLVDLAVDQGFELDGTCKRALDAFTHGRNLAADGLTDHHDAILGDLLRLGQAKSHLRHRLSGDAHLLRAANHGCKRPEQEDRQDRSDCQANQFGTGEKLAGRADLPNAWAKQQICQCTGARDPGERNERHDPVDRVRGTPIEGVQQRLVIFLTRIVGRREAGRLRAIARFNGARFNRARLKRARPKKARFNRAQFSRARFRRLGVCRFSLVLGFLVLIGGRLGILARVGDRLGILALVGDRLGILALVGDRLGILVTALTCQLVGGLRYLRFQILHRRGDVEIAAGIAAQIDFKCFFEFPGYVVVKRSCRRCFLRHAFATLYKLPRDLLMLLFVSHARG